MNFLNKILNLSLLLSLFLFSCDSDDDDNIDIDNKYKVDLTEAFLTDLPLKDINLRGITINQPHLSNGKETEEGTIVIESANPSYIRSYILEEVNIDLSKFNITPSVGSQIYFPNDEVVKFEIISTKSAEYVIHYNVKINFIGTEPQPETTQKAYFKSFSLTTEDQITKEGEVKHDPYSIYDSLIVVIYDNPAAFNKLMPSVEFSGKKLMYKYKTDENFKAYTKGENLNFEYPNEIIFQVVNEDESSVAEYQIMVDCKNPLRFESNELILPNTPINEQFERNDFLAFTNQGNHPIKTLRPHDYTILSPEMSIDYNIFTLLINTQSSRILPKASGQFKFHTKAAPVPATYKSLANFKLAYNPQDKTIIRSPSSIYDFNIYNDVQLITEITITEE